MPDEYHGYAPVLISPDREAPLPLRQRIEDGRAWVEVPRVDVYAIIRWGDADYIEAKTDCAQAWNLGMRMVAMGQPMPEDWWRRLQVDWDARDYFSIRGRLAKWEKVIRAVESEVLAELP